MKNLFLALLSGAFTLLLTAQGAQAQQYQAPYQAYPAYPYNAGAPMPPGQMPPMQYQYQPSAAMPQYMPPMQPMQPMQSPPMQAKRASAVDQDQYETTSSTMSPYEQQELALKEAKMIRELESMKESREMAESFRQSTDSDRTRTSSIQEEGYLAESGKKGKFRRTLGGVGSAFKNTAKVAGPTAASLGSSVGTFFLMRAILGPPTY
ncbi:hypothetical protein GC174_16100 [bacterium]|nr:hypothetical protein [bacterium]